MTLEWDERTNVVFIGTGDIEINRRWLVEMWRALNGWWMERAEWLMRQVMGRQRTVKRK